LTTTSTAPIPKERTNLPVKPKTMSTVVQVAVTLQVSVLTIERTCVSFGLTILHIPQRPQFLHHVGRFFILCAATPFRNVGSF